MQDTTDPFNWNFDLPPAVEGENYGETFRKSLVSKSVNEKAQRLIEEGRVIHIRGHVYQVRGDSGIYTVHVSYPQEVTGVCDCPAKVTCSHLIAACGHELANPPAKIDDGLDPFRGLA